MNNRKRFRRMWSWLILRTILSFTQKNLGKGTKIFSELRVFLWRFNPDTPRTMQALPRCKSVQWCVYFCLFHHYTKHPLLELPTNNILKNWLEYSKLKGKLVQIAEKLNTIAFLRGRRLILDPFRNKIFLQQVWKNENKIIIVSEEY